MTSVNGVVTDSSGVPIGGATIRVTPTEAFKDILDKPRIATTRDDGGFDLSFTYRPGRAEFMMTVTHEGYAEFQATFENGGYNDRVIRLRPLPDEK